MVSVIIPAFNEEDAIIVTIETARRVLHDGGHKDVEIIVVDDASTDETAARAESVSARVLRKPQNVGYGHSLKLGIRNAKHDTIVITDADGTYPFEEVLKLLEMYNNGIDMAIGARTGKYYHESIIKHPLRLTLKILVEFTAGRKIPDPNSGLRVFSRKTIMPFFDQLSDTFSFTTSSTLAYMLSRLAVDYHDIPYHKRVGKTKVRLFRDSLRTLQHITQTIVYYNPLKLFVLLSLLLVLMGIGTLIAHAQGMQIGLGVAVECIIAAITVFALGLICDSIRQHRRKHEN